MATAISFEKFGETSFELKTPEGTSAVSFPLNGRHNVMNAIAAAAVGHAFGLSARSIAAIEAATSMATARDFHGNGSRLPWQPFATPGTPQRPPAPERVGYPPAAEDAACGELYPKSLPRYSVSNLNNGGAVKHPVSVVALCIASLFLGAALQKYYDSHRSARQAAESTGPQAGTAGAMVDNTLPSRISIDLV